MVNFVEVDGSVMELEAKEVDAALSAARHVSKSLGHASVTTSSVYIKYEHGNTAEVRPGKYDLSKGPAT